MRITVHKLEKTQQKKAPVIQIDQEVLHNNLSDYVRKNLEDVLNELPDAEADRLCHAKRYERNAERASTRVGSCKRNFETTSGKVTLNIPRLRNLPFETAIIERYRRRESSIEEAMMEMYLAGVSVRRVEDITEALWGAGVSAGTISNLNKKIYGDIEEWQKRLSSDRSMDPLNDRLLAPPRQLPELARWGCDN